MGTIGLFLSGATLFLNSLMLLGRANSKSVAVFNLFVGFIQVITPFYLIVTSVDQSNWMHFNTGVTFLFGLTFLFTGVVNLKEYEGDALGWFSLWVAIIALVYAFVAIARSNDLLGMLTWIHWSFLWALFFISLSLKKKIEIYVGKVAMVQSWLTLTLPTLFTLTGISDLTLARTLLLGAMFLSTIYFIIAAFSYRKSYATKVKPIHNN